MYDLMARDALGEGLLGVGRLTDAAARAALSKPLTRHDVEIDADALDAVIEDSQRYPYFIQLWGDALWQWHLAKSQRSPHDRGDGCRARRGQRSRGELLRRSLPRVGGWRPAVGSNSNRSTLPRRHGRHGLQPRDRQRPLGRRSRRLRGSVCRFRGTEPPQLHVAFPQANCRPCFGASVFLH